MKILLFFWMLPNVFALLYPLKSAKKIGDEKLELGFTGYYGIPCNDQDADFTTTKIHIEVAGDPNSKNDPLEFPTTEVILLQVLDTYEILKVYNENPSQSRTGYVYFTKDNEETSVYQWKKESFSVTSDKRYTIVFSKSSNGTTLSKFSVMNGAFRIFSKLPDDENRTLLYTHDSKITIDKFYIPEAYFYIDLDDGAQLNFTVDDGGEDPVNETFDSSGVILTPGFPNLPPDEYLKLSVKVKPSKVDRAITIQISAAFATAAEKALQNLAASNDEGLSIAVGAGICFFGTSADGKVSTGKCKQTIPANSGSFNINSIGSAYLVQFDIDQIEPTTSAAPTTEKPHTETCAPVTCPPVTKCPTLNPCLTTSTEISTTTQSSSTFSLTSVFTVIFAFYFC